MNPRDYQAEALNALWRHVKPGSAHPLNPIVALPCGTGKGPLPCWLIQHYLTVKPHARFLSVTHVQELVAQNADKAGTILPDVDTGVYCADLGRREIRQLTFASVQSIHRRASEFGHIDLVFLDEAHLLSAKADAMYGRLFNGLREINPDLRVIGLTATPYRTDSGCLTNSPFFDSIVIDYTVGDRYLKLQNEGYLAPLTAPDDGFLIDTSSVHVVRGDYVDEEAVDLFASNADLILARILKYGQSRRAWCVFCQTIDHAEAITQQLVSAGVNAIGVHSRMSKDQRAAAIANFRAGHHQAIVNVGILTTGTDIPRIDMIVTLRMMTSPGLWRQILGRGTRPLYAPYHDLSTAESRLAAMAAGDKSAGCLVLDFGNNAQRLGAMNESPPLPKPKGRRKNKRPQDEVVEPSEPRQLQTLHLDASRAPLVVYQQHLSELISKEQLYAELLGYVQQENHRRRLRGIQPINPTWAKCTYKEVFGVWPRGAVITVPAAPPSEAVKTLATKKSSEWRKKRKNES
jgi:DNA repair protein RadD